MITLGKTPETATGIKEGMEVFLGGKRYVMRKSIFGRDGEERKELWFLYGMGIYANDEMFIDLHIENRDQWCKDNNIDTDEAGIFPYMKKNDFARALTLLKKEFARQGF